MVLIGDTYLICYNGLGVGIWFCEWKLFWFGILYIFKRVIEKTQFNIFRIIYRIILKYLWVTLDFTRNVYNSKFMMFFKRNLFFHLMNISRNIFLLDRLPRIFLKVIAIIKTSVDDPNEQNGHLPLKQVSYFNSKYYLFFLLKLQQCCT